MHSGERPVDDRVQGAIELLNSAIDNVNLLEDEKNCLAKQVTAAASVEGVLDREVSAVESRLAPLHDALDAESVASSAAGEAEKRFARALGELEMAKEALAVMHSDTRHCVPSRDPAVRQMDARLREKVAACDRRVAAARQEATRLRSAASRASQKVAAAEAALERKLGGELDGVIELESTYREQLDGLQKVQELCDDRLVEIEAKKEEAVARVADAMQTLESLSNELHEQQGGGGQSDEQGAGRQRDESSCCAAQVDALDGGRSGATEPLGDS